MQQTRRAPFCGQRHPRRHRQTPKPPLRRRSRAATARRAEAVCEPLRERKLVRFHAPREESYDETGLVNALETLASNPALLLRSGFREDARAREGHVPQDPRLKGGG